MDFNYGYGLEKRRVHGHAVLNVLDLFVFYTALPLGGFGIQTCHLAISFLDVGIF